MSESPDQQGVQPMTTELLLRVVANCLNQTFTGEMEPEMCLAISTAANAYAALYTMQRLETKISILEKQLILQSSGVNA